MQNSKKRELYYLLREYQREKRLNRRRNYNHSYLREGNYRHRYLNETFEQDVEKMAEQHIQILQDIQRKSESIQSVLDAIEAVKKQDAIIIKKMIEKMQQSDKDVLKTKNWLIRLKQVPKNARIVAPYQKIVEFLYTKVSPEIIRLAEQFKQKQMQAKRAETKIDIQITDIRSESISDIIKNLWYKFRSLFDRLTKFHRLAQSLPEIPQD